MFQGPTKRAHRKLQPLWAKLETRWNDERAHHAFLAHVQSSADYAYARRLYRMAALQASSKQELPREANAWRWLAAVEMRHRHQQKQPLLLNLSRTILLAMLVIEASATRGYPLLRPVASLAVLEIGAWVFRRLSGLRQTREATPHLLTEA